MTVLFLTEKNLVLEMMVHFYHHNHGLPCISSVTRDCISSTLVVVYHHAVACMRCPFQEILRYALNDRTSIEMTVLFFSRHFDQVKRVEKSPKAKQCHNYSYHNQGDLSTTLEMTVLCQTFRKNIPQDNRSNHFFLILI